MAYELLALNQWHIDPFVIEERWTDEQFNLFVMRAEERLTSRTRAAQALPTESGDNRRASSSPATSRAPRQQPINTMTGDEMLSKIEQNVTPYPYIKKRKKAD